MGFLTNYLLRAEQTRESYNLGLALVSGYLQLILVEADDCRFICK
jgi:hypothetical protein